MYRTIAGWPACAYSRDGGYTWTTPAFAAYTPGGKRIKHPRAANFVWKCSNGKYLYWYHNHGGAIVGERFAAGEGSFPYEDRNPAWLAAGVEHDSPEGKVIHWSQPEILLYDDDPFIRMSYPDLIEEDGRFFVTETQKNIGRTHAIPEALLDGLFRQFENASVATEGCALDLPGDAPMPATAAMPKLPPLVGHDYRHLDARGKDLRAGFSFDLWFQLDSLEPGQVLLDSRDDVGIGIVLATSEKGTVQLRMNDGRQEVSWDCDREALRPGSVQHMGVIVDGGPKIILLVVDGVLCDGGEERQFGWGRYSPTLRTPQGSDTPRIGPAVRALRLYTRALRTSEMMGNYRAGLPQAQ